MGSRHAPVVENSCSRIIRQIFFCVFTFQEKFSIRTKRNLSDTVVVSPNALLVAVVLH